MRRLLPAALALGILLVVPAPAHAWGFAAHRFIMDRAIALLPSELRPLFEKYRAEIVDRAIDPDLWITAGWEDERPYHFVDMDYEGTGPYPFTGLPHDYSAALEKFGAAKMRTIGTLPWRAEEMYGSLRRAFAAAPTRSAVADQNVVHFSSWLAHYISDAYVPLHSVTNYNGQLTQQTGLHFRWEDNLFERNRNQLTIAPKPIAPIHDPREFAFARLLEGTQLAPALLQADRDAIGDRDVYDDAYYAAFFKAQRGTLEDRLNGSIAAVAAIITGAWEAAGKPAMPMSIPDTQRRSRPRPGTSIAP